VRRRLDETKLTKEIQSCRTPTNAEVREHLGARLNRTQRLLDRLENGETLDQRAQQQQAYLSQL
jgi:ribosome assembly protein YihI (activator of Der GTPase)